MSTLVYLLIPFQIPGNWQILVAVGMTIATILGASMYRPKTEGQNELESRMLMYFEVIAYGLFILFSGGFYSPYLWYALGAVVMVMALGVSYIVSIISILWCFICAFMGQYLGLIPNGGRLEVNIGIGFVVLTGALYILLQYVRRLIDSQRELAGLQELLAEYVTAQEQTRIGGELHDTTIQKLFAVVCRLHIVSEQGDCEIEVKKHLKGIGDSIEVIMKELREAIYGLSWDNGDLFQSKLTAYLEKVRAINGTDIVLNIDGSVEVMTAFQKTTFYRIICEGVDYVVDHGKATWVEVKLQVKANQLCGTISNDGYQIQVSKSKKNYQELRNMHYLIMLMKGKLQIETQETGAQIVISLPR